MKFLGIDYGTKKVGIAISNEAETIAFPLRVILNNKNLVDTIKKICDKEKTHKIIIGKSINYKREPNKIFVEILAFQKKIKTEINIPTILYDETLTTQAAKQIQGKNNKLDASAAALILQGYLDKKQYEIL